MVAQGHFRSIPGGRAMSVIPPGRLKTPETEKRLENLSQSAEIGSACDALRNKKDSLRNVYAVAIARQSVFTQPTSKADIPRPLAFLNNFAVDVGLGVYKANEISVCHVALQFTLPDL